MMADTENFFQRRHAPKCFIHTIIQQCPHAEESGLAADGLGRLAVESHLADGGVQLHHFEDAEPASVAGMVAVIAAPAAHESGAGKAFGTDAG